jgi:23S rRNA (guanosine2251-2'-O)-methyltransferase
VRKNQQKLNQAALQNKIRNDLLIIGKSALIELLKSNSHAFDFVLVGNSSDKRTSEIINLANSKKVNVIRDHHLLGLVENIEKDNFGICAFLKFPISKTYSLKEISESFDKMDTVLAVAIADMDYLQNVGAMIRTCNAMGVDFIIIPNGQQKVFSTTVTKVSMGYNYLIPVVQENFLLALDNLAKMDFDILGLDMDGENILNMRYNPRVCFVVGNEAKGLSPAITSKTTKKVSIPMHGNVESLNVSVSLGMSLYDYNLKKTIQIPIE